GFAMAARGPGSGSGNSKPPVTGSSGPGSRAFTKDNFRANLGRLTGGIPEGADAHHVFPQKFEEQFRQAGINIHDPRYGTWWETMAHQRAGLMYNQQWKAFLRPGRSAEQ